MARGHVGSRRAGPGQHRLTALARAAPRSVLELGPEVMSARQAAERASFVASEADASTAWGRGRRCGRRGGGCGRRNGRRGRRRHRRWRGGGNSRRRQRSVWSRRSVMSRSSATSCCSAMSWEPSWSRRRLQGRRTGRLGRDHDGPCAPLVLHVAVHLAGSVVLVEPVERLARIGHLECAALALDGAELRCVHALPALAFLTPFGNRTSGQTFRQLVEHDVLPVFSV